MLHYGFVMGITESWDLAQLTDARSGRLGKRVPSGKIAIPLAVKLEGDALVHKAGWKIVQPDKDVLNEFIRLADKPPEAYLKFAKRWGVLYLDSVGRPCVVSGPLDRREPLSVWRHLAQRARAVLNIAASLKLGKSAPWSEWECLTPLAPHTGDFVTDLHRFANSPEFVRFVRRGFADPLVRQQFESERQPKTERMFLNIEVMLWMYLGRVSFTMLPDKTGEWNLETDFNRCLLSFIALQIAMTVAGAHSLFICSCCKVPYVRKTKAPRKDQANYCSECGLEEALRRADSARRERRQQARQMSAAGLSVKAISETLVATPKTVTNWLKGIKNV